MKALSLFLCMCLTTLWGGEKSPADIVRAADEVRNPSNSYFLVCEVVNTEGTTSRFHVAIEDDKTVVETVMPVRDAGRNLLMCAEDMWAYVPNLKRAVRVSLNQKLVGQAANGDIARMRWSGDYTATIAEENEECWVLELVAAKPNLTYDRIRAVIEKGTFHPIKAEYLTKGGKTLKVANFSGYKFIADAVRPTLITIQDAVMTSKTSTIRILALEKRSFPVGIFNRNTLGIARVL